jgi:Protein of unknown function (DUF1501)
MLRILGSPKRLCDGLTRRDWLIAGGLSLGGLAARPALAKDRPAAQSPAEGAFGRAKNVILLYLFGGPSHVEMFDMKPKAPIEVRGELQSVSSSIPGLPICEYLPNVARMMDRVTVVRSLTHPWNFHGMQYATTGLPKGSIPVEETQLHSDHWPFLGSILTSLNHQKYGPKPPGTIPDNVMLPWLLSSRRPAAMYARPHGVYLERQFDPLWGEFRGEATRSVVRRSHGPAEEVFDPHLGIKPEGRFEITPGAELAHGVTLDRLRRQRSLLEQLEEVRREADGNRAAERFSQQRAAAFGLIDSPRVRQALDLARESPALRDAYGMTLFGQGTLQARRLVEAGCRFVTVIWDEYGQLNTGWDTHVDHYNRMKTDLLPGFDKAFSTLCLDLEERGMFDETLVLVLNEMGRTPKLTPNGREHWGFAYTNLLAGAGVARGAVIGKTDSIGAQVVDQPLTSKDMLATAYHLLGVDPQTTLYDRDNRPHPLLPYGAVIGKALA